MRVLHKMILGLTVFGCLLAQSTWAQNGPNLPAAQGKTTLTIAGGGYWHRDVLEDGETPNLSAYDSSGQLLADGRYHYEYKLVPENSKSGRMQGGEGTGSNNHGKDKGRSATVMSGSFEVLGGELVVR